MCLNIKSCKCLISNYTNMSNFKPLEVVGRGSETQLQVGENVKPDNLAGKWLIQKGLGMGTNFTPFCKRTVP